MFLPDVNVLVNAHRTDAPDHETCAAWLTGVVNGPEAYGVAELVLSGFVRVVTHKRVFNPPTPLPDAMRFVETLRSQPHAVAVRPGARHFDLFVDLCRDAGAAGNLVPDAYLAALAIEVGAEWVTLDGDYARFPGLRWRRP